MLRNWTPRTGSSWQQPCTIQPSSGSGGRAPASPPSSPGLLPGSPGVAGVQGVGGLPKSPHVVDTGGEEAPTHAFSMEPGSPDAHDGAHDATSPLLLRDTLGNAKDTPAVAFGDNDLPTPPFMYLFVPLVAIGGTLFGFDTGVVSPALLGITDDLGLNKVQQELVVSITVAGAVVGAAFAGYLADALGRRSVIIVSSAIFTAGALLMAFTPGLTLLLVGRAVVGVGIGMASMVVPMYLAEVAPTHHRGMLVTVNVVFITGGQLVASIVGGAFEDVHEGWRWMLGLSGVPSLFQFVGFLCMPESPRWLIMKRRDDDALKVLRRTRGVTLDMPPVNGKDPQAAIRQELHEMRAAVHNDTQLNLLQVFQRRELHKPLLLGSVLQALQQFAGINLVMYFSSSILRAAGFAVDAAIWLSALVASFNFMFSIVGMLLVDRVGRRPLTLVSLGTVVIALAFIGFVFYGRDHASAAATPYVAPSSSASSLPSLTTASLHDCQKPHLCVDCVTIAGCGFYGDGTGGVCVPGNSSGPTVPVSHMPSYTWQRNQCDGVGLWSTLSVVAMILYLICFAPGMGNMPWTINAEIFPGYARAASTSFTTLVNWVCNFIVSMTFLQLQVAITPAGTFWLYMAIAIAGFVFLLLRLPETKGVNLDDVAQLFE